MDVVMESLEDTPTVNVTSPSVRLSGIGANPKLLLSFNGLPLVQGSPTALTMDGPVVYGNTPVSTQARFFETSTTNLVPQPSGEADFGLVTRATATTVVTKTASPSAVSGSYVAQVVCEGTGAAEGVVYLTNTGLALATNTFTGSIHGRGSGTVRAYLRFYYTDASIMDTNAGPFTLTSSWQRFVVTATSDPTKTIDRISVMIRTATIQAVTFETDAAQIEQKAYATSYCDGSLGTGYAWTGTAHNSTSTRALGYSRLVNEADLINANHGTMFAYFCAPTRVPTSSCIYDIGDTVSGQDLIQARYTTATNLNVVWYTDGLLKGSVGLITTSMDNQWHVLTAQWDGETIRAGLDTNAMSESTRTTTGTVFSGIRHITIGANRQPSVTTAFDGFISTLVYFDEVLSNQDRLRVVNALASGEVTNTNSVFDQVLGSVEVTHGE
jgi:hypothetical protein